MDIPLRHFWRVKPQSVVSTVKNWKAVFSTVEKVVIGLLIAVIVFTVIGWISQLTGGHAVVPRVGGSVEIGTVAPDGPGGVELGRLTQSGLVKTDLSGNILPDLSKNWTISDDKLTYLFELEDKISSSDIMMGFEKRPADFPNIKPKVTSLSGIKITLSEPQAGFLSDLAKPIFPLGPYKIGKQTDKEIRLTRNENYFSQKAYLDQITIKLYADQNALQDAANSGKIDIAYDLDKIPNKWNKKIYNTSTVPMLFVNTSKSYFKKAGARTTLLEGKKPSGFNSIDVLEVNTDPNRFDPDYLKLKKAWKDAGLEVKERQEDVKTALTGSLLERDYDVLYIVLDQGYDRDPYKFYNSTQRSGTGQNFAELGDAEIDKATEESRTIIDPVKRNEKYDEIFKQVADSGVSKVYKPIQLILAYNTRIKGIAPVSCITKSDIFCIASGWYIRTQKK
ncbi:hypothetical protein COT77_01860 [Candidatus Berkelbacteria bacterium CG10_big_fil_rev_8_21_14_0_10_41_12]|uniref:Solute-binding protein family 5 domain-containing protein n=1 Tax=Candidatus Berkelbacteria bacterium CG10_big_fil_rev_8_21_14_0_10_41_12 TaxID=1974513 RepID=A0A2M6WX12_9BACT|nr:MAG: hypothetical protein COT77_01860 [Candidatus Berkelbacteria bacterium CG10_big_fil_rev_8_21_14_0_10_41_12]